MTVWSRDGAEPVQRAAAAARAFALAGALALVGAAGAAAQATPEAGLTADPTTGPCETPTGMAPAEMASPAASPMATPAEGAATAAEEPEPTPVDDQATIDAAVAAAENFIHCWNEGNAEAVVALGTLNYLQTQYGIDSVDEAVEALGAEGALPPITLLETGEVNTYDDGRASLDLVYLLGDHQYTAARWYMVEADGELFIDEQTLRLPQPDVEASTVLGVTFADDATAVSFDQGTNDAGNREVAQLPAVILSMTNLGTQPRMLSVVQLEDAAEESAATPVTGELPTGEFVALVTVPVGAQEDVALVNLDQGIYAVGEMGGPFVLLSITEPAPDA